MKCGKLATQVLAIFGLIFIGVLVRPLIWQDGPKVDTGDVDPDPAVIEPNEEGEKRKKEKKQSKGKNNSTVIATEGEGVEYEPLRPREAPAIVENLDLVRQSLKPGTTHETLLKGSIETLGTDEHWGIKSVVSIFYVFEAMVDRDIIENDGAVVVEDRHFRNVRSIKLDTTLKDVRIQLGPAKIPLITFLAAIWPDAALAFAEFDGISLQPVMQALTALGIDPLKISGAEQSIFKMFTQFDSLTGKSVRQVYHNTKDRTGVIRVTALVGEITEQESFVHHHSAVLSDVLLFPEREKKKGDAWVVKGNAFTNLIDPGLRAAVEGEIHMSRADDRVVNDVKMPVILANSGRLLLTSDDKSANRMGWFEPRGELLFSQKDEVIVEGELKGRGSLEKVSKTHLLFKTQMKQEPVIKVTYSCRIKNTVATESNK